MDLVTLDDNNQAKALVENWDSLIWAERFNTTGDFQIVTGAVDRFMQMLPEGQVVALLDSPVPMVVETHLIERRKNTPTKLTIKGRAFESILDRRASVESVASGAEWVVVVLTPSDAAYYVIEQVCVTGVAAPEDVFPGFFVQFVTPDDYLTSTGPARAFAIPRGQLLPAVLQLLQTQSSEDTTTTPVTPAVVPHGIGSFRPDASGTAIGVHIYTGTDRSDVVYFDATRELLDDGSYLFSKVGSANTAYVMSNTDAVLINRDPLGAASGLERRVIFVDGANAGDDSALVDMGKTALAMASETAIFDGSLNQDLNFYRYGIDYNLGDVVKLVGDYGLSKKARVTEYIRSEDATGYKAYPTLTALDEGAA